MPTRGFRSAVVAMFEAMSDAAAVLELVDDELRIVAANPVFAASFNTGTEQLRGRRAAELYRPGEYDDVLEHVHVALERQESVSYEAVRELPSGRRVIAATMVPSGQRQVVVLKRDISAKQEALRRLAELESLAKIGVWQLNLVTGSVTWSDQYRQILGLPPDVEPTMQLILDAVHPDDREFVLRIIDEVRKGREEPRTMTYRILRLDGQVRFVETRGNVARDGDDIVRVFGTIQDVSEMHLAERRRQELERAQYRQQQAAELNDDIVQGLAAAWLALELGEVDEAMRAIQRTSRNAQHHVSALIRPNGDERPIPSGVLARLNASNADLDTTS